MVKSSKTAAEILAEIEEVGLKPEQVSVLAKVTEDAYPQGPEQSSAHGEPSLAELAAKLDEVLGRLESIEAHLSSE